MAEKRKRSEELDRLYTPMIKGGLTGFDQGYNYYSRLPISTATPEGDTEDLIRFLGKPLKEQKEAPYTPISRPEYGKQHARQSEAPLQGNSLQDYEARQKKKSDEEAAAGIILDSVKKGVNAGGGLGTFGGGPGFLLSDGSVIAQGAKVPEGLSVVGSAPAPASGFLPAAAGAAGTAAAIYNGLDAANNIFSDSRRGKGAVEGATTLAGTAAGAIFGGPIGAGIGSIAGRTLGRGIASIGDRLGFIGQPSGDEIMQDRINSLLGNEVALPDFVQQNPGDYGLTQDQLIERESQKQEAGEWGNSQFAASRNEADLEPEDVWGGLPMFEMYGNDWLGEMTAKQRWEASQALLDSGLIREDRGQLWIDDKEAARAVADAAINGEAELSKYYEDGWYYNNKAPQQAAPAEQQQQQGSREPARNDQGRRRPGGGPIKPFEMPEAPVLPLPQPEQPPLKSAQDYADAYMALYERATGGAINNPLNRRY